jgi:hypothetical protein
MATEDKLIARLVPATYKDGKMYSYVNPEAQQADDFFDLVSVNMNDTNLKIAALNSTGKFRELPNNTPYVDYTFSDIGGSVTCPAIMLSPPYTNMLDKFKTFSDWTAENLTHTTETTDSPFDNGDQYYKFTADAGGPPYKLTSPNVGGTYDYGEAMLTFIVKGDTTAGSGTKIKMNYIGDSDVEYVIGYNFEDDSIYARTDSATYTNFNYYVYQLSNGWRQISFYAIPNMTEARPITIELEDGGWFSIAQANMMGYTESQTATLLPIVIPQSHDESVSYSKGYSKLYSNNLGTDFIKNKTFYTYIFFPNFNDVFTIQANNQYLTFENDAVDTRLWAAASSTQICFYLRVNGVDIFSSDCITNWYHQGTTTYQAKIAVTIDDNWQAVFLNGVKVLEATIDLTGVSTDDTLKYKSFEDVYDQGYYIKSLAIYSPLDEAESISLTTI